jgi:ectoine hydroxylase-related dioxygenase (phytanoyl-CoA dioxygenase family)
MNTITAGITKEQIDYWNREGYLIVRGLFRPAEVAEIEQHFDAIGATGEKVPGYWEPDSSPESAGDPLKRYPRVMQPHRWDNGFSQRYLLHPGVHEVLAALYGEEPVATQSMFYFKPPGARGQALHQDNFYLQVKPGTCIAAWTAIDPATPENGGLYVVPGTHHMEVVCPETAAAGESFTTHLVKVPKGKKAVPAELQPGDTLFFNGSVVHGSPPNRSKTLWRRAFICHYMPRSARYIAKFYAPLFDFAGHLVEKDLSTEGGPCGKEFEPSQYGSYGKWH